MKNANITSTNGLMGNLSRRGEKSLKSENKALKGYDTQLGLSQFEYGLFINV